MVIDYMQLELLICIVSYTFGEVVGVSRDTVIYCLEYFSNSYNVCSPKKLNFVLMQIDFVFGCTYAH